MSPSELIKTSLELDSSYDKWRALFNVVKTHHGPPLLSHGSSRWFQMSRWHPPSEANLQEAFLDSLNFVDPGEHERLKEPESAQECLTIVSLEILHDLGFDFDTVIRATNKRMQGMAPLDALKEAGEDSDKEEKLDRLVKKLVSDRKAKQRRKERCELARRAEKARNAILREIRYSNTPPFTD